MTLPDKMATSTIILVFSILSFIKECSADLCFTYYYYYSYSFYYKYCADGCCGYSSSRYCCSASLSVGGIVGLVIGILIVCAIVAVVIIIIIKQKNHRRGVVRTSPVRSTVIVQQSGPSHPQPAMVPQPPPYGQDPAYPPPQGVYPPPPPGPHGPGPYGPGPYGHGPPPKY